jgi:hypothetical protein
MISNEIKNGKDFDQGEFGAGEIYLGRKMRCKGDEIAQGWEGRNRGISAFSKGSPDPKKVKTYLIELSFSIERPKLPTLEEPVSKENLNHLQPEGISRFVSRDLLW